MVARKCRWGVAYLEQLLAVNAFVDHVTEARVIKLDRETQEKARRCKELALRVLIACIRRPLLLLLQPVAEGGRRFQK